MLLIVLGLYYPRFSGLPSALSQDPFPVYLQLAGMTGLSDGHFPVAFRAIVFITLLVYVIHFMGMFFLCHNTPPILKL
jgi:hypothetical protein